MARKATVEKELKREKLVAKYDKKRTAIKSRLKEIYKSMEEDPNADYEALDHEREELQEKLGKLPNNSVPIRRQRRCKVTGRPHGVYRKFGLCRNKLREWAMRGWIPGIRKSSW